MPTTPKDEVSVLIGGKEFRAWATVAIHQQMDSFSVVEFTAPFESDRREFRDIFRPFSFHPLEVRVDGETVITGTQVGISPAEDPNSSAVAVTGYSLPGVLADCSGPETYLPLEFKEQGLKVISRALAYPFGIEVQFDAEEGAVFEKAKIEPGTAPFGFLADLARQRNAVLSSTPAGKLWCLHSTKTGSPVARLRAGEQPVGAVSASFSPQAYFSELTGFVDARKGTKKKPAREGSRYTVKNPWLSNALRPSAFKLADTPPADAPAAVRAKMGRMFANACSFTVPVATWNDPSGKRWTPNTTVTLLAPNAMVYRETEMLIRAVSLRQDKENTAATLELVLPGAFSGELPEVLPWDEGPSLSGGLLEQVAGLV